MRRRFTTMLAAGLITEVSLATLFFAPRPTWLLYLVAMPALPGHALTLRLGLGGGPEGFPVFADPPLHVITFLLWWPTLELVRAGWGRYRPTPSTRPMEPR
jgi:hypothetical protein